MKRDERKDDFVESVCELPNPRWISPKYSFFFNYWHDPNSIFRVKGIISAGVSGGTVSLRTRKLDDRVVSRDRSFREFWCDVFMSRCLQICWPSKWLGNHFLMETRIICLIKQDLNELVRQEHQVGSLDNCIEELQHQAYAQRLELEDAQHGNIESRQEQTRLQEELTVTEKVFEKLR